MNGHISNGKWNDAFQASLMANNLQLVVSTCESVNPMQLFNQNPCPLSQSVLLSLIQQLGKLLHFVWKFVAAVIAPKAKILNQNLLYPAEWSKTPVLQIQVASGRLGPRFKSSSGHMVANDLI